MIKKYVKQDYILNLRRNVPTKKAIIISIKL